jgi:hypothetical protein
MDGRESWFVTDGSWRWRRQSSIRLLSVQSRAPSKHSCREHRKSQEESPPQPNQYCPPAHSEYPLIDCSSEGRRLIAGVVAFKGDSESKMLHLAVTVVLSLLNGGITAYLLCQLVEVLLGLHIALRRSQAGRVLIALTAQLSGLIAITILSFLSVVELAVSLLRTQIAPPVWPVTSSGVGMGVVLVSLIFSSRFREQISAGAEDRLATISHGGTILSRSSRDK